MTITFDSSTPIKSNLLSNTAFLIVSCDKYKDVWEPFFKLFFKYWPDCPFPIFLGTNTLTYRDSRITPIMIGADIDYSSNLINMIEQIPQEWVITCIDDLLITDPVNTDRVLNMVKAAEKLDATYLKLITVGPYATEPLVNEYFGEIAKGTPYRVSFMIALWKKPDLLHLLKPGETAWEIEFQGSERSNTFEGKFFSLNSNLSHTPHIPWLNGVKKGRWTIDAVKLLKKEGMKKLLGTRSRITNKWLFRRKIISYSYLLCKRFGIRPKERLRKTIKFLSNYSILIKKYFIK